MDKESDDSSSTTGTANGTSVEETRRASSASEKNNKAKNSKLKTPKSVNGREPKDRAKSPVVDGPPSSPVAESVEETEDDSVNTWECSLCTFRNSPEAFKCSMCDVRKGTSTRKPRINPQLVAEQVARQQQQILKASSKTTEKEKIDIKPEKKLIVESKKESDKLEKKETDSKRLTASTEKRKSSDIDASPGPSKIKKEKKPKLDLDNSSKTVGNGRSKFKDIDRTNRCSKAITVNNVTVIITEFQPKTKNKVD
ncbi:RING1 and YY1-binding protein B [Halotydeus destructor]|nr:RING1 and YY1-binding protein B [Halotydeus destructor]